MNQYLSFNDFLADVSIKFEHQHREGGDLRYGQMYFNLLSLSRPEIAEKIRSTDMDPFHKDNVSPKTHNFVESLW